MSSGLPRALLVQFIFFFVSVGYAVAGKRHVINFRSPNLFPESLAWDSSAQHFVVGSLHQRSIHGVSDAGVVETLVSDPDLPPNVTILGVAVDSVNRRLLAVIHAMEPLPPFDSLAAYDLRSRKRLFLATLADDVTSDRQIANDVAVDFEGNAYVTNSAGNLIWKVNLNGESSILSRSPIFTPQNLNSDQFNSFRGLNGIAYISKGYLLVVQTNTGKLFKVDADDGKARLVLLPRELTSAEGIAVRRDGVVVVVSQQKAWLLKSDDSWGEGAVYDEIALDTDKFPTSVAVREDRAYVLYGHANEGLLGNVHRDEFSIEELTSEKDSEDEPVWMFVLIGFGLVYFLYWRFQMGQVVKNMNKKTA